MRESKIILLRSQRSDDRQRQPWDGKRMLSRALLRRPNRLQSPPFSPRSPHFLRRVPPQHLHDTFITKVHLTIIRWAGKDLAHVTNDSSRAAALHSSQHRAPTASPCALQEWLQCLQVHAHNPVTSRLSYAKEPSGGEKCGVMSSDRGARTVSD